MAEGDGSNARAVVVTGASTGIGEACALRLDTMGWRVFAGVRRDEDGARLKEKASDRLAPVFIDVTDGASILSAAENVTATVAGTGLAGLVNNAGIALGGPLEYLPVDELRRQLEVNVVGQIAVTQAFLPLLREGRGRVVNIGSSNGMLATPFFGPYCASKFALEGLTDSLRQELRPWGIEVSVVQPGSIATPIWDKGRATADELEEKLPQEALDLYGGAFIAVRKAIDEQEKRGVPPDEVAKAVAHALAARRPKTRYTVGWDARLEVTLARLVPDRLRDRVVAWQMGLGSKW